MQLTTPYTAQVTRVTAQNKRKKSMMLLGGVGVYDGITLRNVKRLLAGSDEVDELVVGIASPGGSVWQGLSIHNLFKSHPAADKTCYIMGECASAATLISSAFPRTVASEASVFMVHESSTYTGGNKSQLRKAADTLGVHDEVMINIYQKKTGLNRRKLRSIVEAETWMTAKEAKKLGFVDEVVDSFEMQYDEELGNEEAHNFFLYQQARTAAFTKQLRSRGIYHSPIT